jgi:hypothetical protein
VLALERMKVTGGSIMGAISAPQGLPPHKSHRNDGFVYPSLFLEWRELAIFRGASWWDFGCVTPRSAGTVEAESNRHTSSVCAGMRGGRLDIIGVLKGCHKEKPSLRRNCVLGSER